MPHHAFTVRFRGGLEMDAWANLIAALSSANPLVLVAFVCVVALLVVGECVRQFCKALSGRSED